MDKKIKRERSSATKTHILSILEEKKQALAHKDIQLLLDNSVDRVTIYRALDRLVDEGKIHKVTGMEGIVQYAICHNCNKEEHHHNHIHFHCVQCETISCIEKVEPKFKLPDGYTVENVQCMVSGICTNCNSL